MGGILLRDMAKYRKSFLYTRAGDQGETSLFGGRRVSKADVRVDAYGRVDELNCAIGVAVACSSRGKLPGILEAIQNELFNVGAELATPCPADDGGALISLAKEKISELEIWIDEYDAKLPPLKTFVLPGGSVLAAQLHLARAVCRGAERAVVKMGGLEEVNPNLIAYLNRLSDLLFVLARYANKASRKKELLWRKD